MEALKTAPSSFTLTSRNPEKQRHVGGNTLTFGLVTGPPNVHDRIKVGAARSIEHARTTATELHMVNVRSAVHIGGSEFYKVHPAMGNQPTSAIEEAILPSAKDMLDQLIWWGEATKAKRAEAKVA